MSNSNGGKYFRGLMQKSFQITKAKELDDIDQVVTKMNFVWFFG